METLFFIEAAFVKKLVSIPKAYLDNRVGQGPCGPFPP
jgi:hypothetical protein